MPGGWWLMGMLDADAADEEMEGDGACPRGGGDIWAGGAGCPGWLCC